MTGRASQGYKVLRHTADIGIIACGKDMRETFANTAKGMFHLITDLRKVQCWLKKDVEISAGDPESLLVTWLNELIYLFDVEHILFRKFVITGLTDTRMKAYIYGEKVDSSRHQLRLGIKATTYHMLEIKQANGIWTARVIFDV